MNGEKTCENCRWHGTWISICCNLDSPKCGYATRYDYSCEHFEGISRTQRIKLTPCDFCRYNPPSEDSDKKPCLTCPAAGAKEDDG